LYEGGILGITAGAHRLWSHRAYKATWQLRLILMLLHTLAFQVRMSSFLLGWWWWWYSTQFVVRCCTVL